METFIEGEINKVILRIPFSGLWRPVVWYTGTTSQTTRQQILEDESHNIYLCENFKSRKRYGKFIPVFNLAVQPEDVFASIVIAPHIIYIGTRCRWVASFNPGRMSRRYPQYTRLGETQSRFGRSEEEKNIFFSARNQTPVRPPSSSPNHYMKGNKILMHCRHSK